MVNQFYILLIILLQINSPIGSSLKKKKIKNQSNRKNAAAAKNLNENASKDF